MMQYDKNMMLVGAVMASDFEGTKRALELGASPDSGYDLESLLAIPPKDKYALQAFETVLIEACKYGWSHIVKLLLDSGAEINLPNYYDNTPLTAASAGKHIGTVRLLFEYGATIDASNTYGLVSLCDIVSQGSENDMKMLVNAVRNVNKPDNIGNTPMLKAISKKALTVLRLLIDAGADLNGIGVAGITPLIHGTLKGSQEIVRILVEAGADVNVKTETGLTAVMCSARSGHTNIMEILVEAGARLDDMDSDGYKVLEILKYWHPGKYSEWVCQMKMKKLVCEDSQDLPGISAMPDFSL